MHFFNLAAAREWLDSGTGMCPLTRKRIARVLEVPDLRRDPDGWFHAVDIDGDGRLSRMEVVECLKAQLPVDGPALDAALVDPTHWMWQQWDVDGSGYIERRELLSEQGLAAYVRSAFERAADPDAIPDIHRDKEAWYRCAPRRALRRLELCARAPSRSAEHHARARARRGRFWDEDNSGSLDKEEVVRALLKTFRMTSDQHQVFQMRSTIDAIWPMFDDDGSGSIERNEFLRPNEGLADTIVATLGMVR